MDGMEPICIWSGMSTEKPGQARTLRGNVEPEFA